MRRGGEQKARDGCCLACDLQAVSYQALTDCYGRAEVEDEDEREDDLNNAAQTTATASTDEHSGDAQLESEQEHVSKTSLCKGISRVKETSAKYMSPAMRGRR